MEGASFAMKSLLLSCAETTEVFGRFRSDILVDLHHNSRRKKKTHDIRKPRELFSGPQRVPPSKCILPAKIFLALLNVKEDMRIILVSVGNKHPLFIIVDAHP